MKAPRPNTSELLPLEQYDRVVVAFSGGKDSLACALHLLELGVPAEKLELWHHRIDGAPGSDVFMDWPVTDGYCRAVAAELGLTLRFSWKQGGFRQEMLRDEQPTAPTVFEGSDGELHEVGGRGPLGTRRLFPQVSADLKVRWCSAYLKVDVARRALANDPAYKAGQFLFVTGERRQESAARSRYAEVEAHASSNRNRRVDQWRPILEWNEAQVWEIIGRHQLEPHPAYRLGWGRLSCRTCIFGDCNQWASVREIAPQVFSEIAALEREFGKTIQRNASVEQLADAGQAYAEVQDVNLVALANGEQYEETVRVENWELPAGAFKHDGGPC